MSVYARAVCARCEPRARGETSVSRQQLRVHLGGDRYQTYCGKRTQYVLRTYSQDVFVRTALRPRQPGKQYACVDCLAKLERGMLST